MPRQEDLAARTFTTPPHGRRRKLHVLMVYGSPHFALPGVAAMFSPALNVSTTTNKLRAIAGRCLVAASPLQVAQLVQQFVVQPGSSRVALVPVPAVADFVETLAPSDHCSSLLAELDGLEASHTRLEHLGTSPLAPAAMDLSAVAALQLHTNMDSIPVLQHPPAWRSAQYGIQASEQLPDLPELCSFFQQHLESRRDGSATRRLSPSTCMQQATCIRGFVGFVRRVLGHRYTGMLEAYANTMWMGQFILFLEWRGTCGEYIQQQVKTAERVMRFYLTKAQLNSVEAANLSKLAHHYHVWHPQVLEMGRVPDTTLEARQRRGTILTASQLLSLVLEFKDQGERVLELPSRKWTPSMAWTVQRACMWMQTFGFHLTQRPGQLLSWVCSNSPVLCSHSMGPNPDCREPDCPGNVVSVMPGGSGVVVNITHHKNSRRLRQGLGTTEWRRDTPMGRLLVAHLLVGRPILVRGAVLPPDFDPSRQPSFCWINMDGLPFTRNQWWEQFSRGTLAAFGVAMSPIAARHLTVGVVCDGYPGAPTRQQAADVMGHTLDQQQKSYWLGRQQKSNEAGQAGMEGFRNEVLRQGTPCAAAEEPSLILEEDDINWLSAESDSDNEFR